MTALHLVLVAFVIILVSGRQIQPLRLAHS